MTINTLELRRIFGKRYPEKQLQRFFKYHEDNPSIYRTFVQMAKEMRMTGRTRYSSRSLFEVMRWHHDLTTTGDWYKVNNTFISMYSRLAMAEHEELNDFFSIRSWGENRDVS